MPDCPRQRIVLNAAAGSVEDAGALEQRLRALPHTEVVCTRAPGDAARAARDAAETGIPRVVAAGGDGTLHEVVQGLARCFDRVQLGLLPLGTGNDFARFVGIPSELDAALAILESGEEWGVDVVRLEVAGEDTRWILNASSAGFSAVVSGRADGKKDGWGALAYSLGAMQAIPELQAYRLRVQVDDDPPEELEAWSLVLANGGSIAGGIRIAPDARVDDGRAELLVVPQMPMTTLAVVLPKILLGQHTEEDALFRRAVRRLRVESDPPMPLNADGEAAGETPVFYEVEPRRVRLVTARS
ncbi:MAG TPA: diacylglycerol kinase family protein [Candidatus Polarisedimenticolaceae bacterium]|nr:diacylglycerol kinase family protein [Candidatus Polarisedimenticolaceae bacterium]